jgi:hypothetical protein
MNNYILFFGNFINEICVREIYCPWHRCVYRLCGLVVSVLGYRSRGPGFYSRLYRIFWEVVGLKRGPLSLMRIIQELHEWKSSGSGYRRRRLTAVGVRRADHATPSIRKSLSISPTSDGRLVGIVRLRTNATEFSFFFKTHVFYWTGW